MESTEKGKNKSTIKGFFSIIVIVIGIIGILLLFEKGAEASTNWLGELPWYILFPVCGAIIYVIYLFGKNQKWW
jgi:hypothetical protein